MERVEKASRQEGEKKGNGNMRDEMFVLT